jgi:hypothetical protein
MRRKGIHATVWLRMVRKSLLVSLMNKGEIGAGSLLKGG